MRLTLDRIEANPPHALSPEEARAFVRLLPKELVQDLEHIRLSSAMGRSQIQTIVHFSRLEKRLVVRSRGVPAEDVIRSVVECLARENLREAAGYGAKSTAISDKALKSYVDEAASEIQLRMPPSPHWNRVELKYVRRSNVQGA